MALIKSNSKGVHYSQNIIDNLLSFNEDSAWTTPTGTGTASIEKTLYFEGSGCLNIENTDVVNDIVAQNVVQSTVIKIEGVYDLGIYMLKKEALLVVNGNVEIFKNGVSLDTQTFSLGSETAEDDNTNEWVSFFTNENYSLSPNDEITFLFQVDGIPGSVLTSLDLFIDGFMFYEKSRRQLETPLFSKSINTNESTSKYIEVDSLSDLPSAVSGVITLLDGYTYMLNTDIDLSGSRIDSSNAIVNLYGRSSETSGLTSTGLTAGTPLITSNTTIKLANLTIEEVDTGLSLNKASVMALDWIGVNFVNIPNLWNLGDFDNLILETCVISNCNNGLIEGEFDSFVCKDSLLGGDGLAGNLLDFTATSIVNRRIRIQDSPIVVTGDTTGIQLNSSAAINDESFILKYNNFTGNGTYLGDTDYTSNKSDFIDNVGIQGTNSISWLYMNSNATETVLTQDTPTKILGTTTSDSITSGFTNTNNRITYTRAKTRLFNITSILTFPTVSDIDAYIFTHYKNGLEITGTAQTQVTDVTNNGTQGYHVTLQSIVSLETNDYIEVYVENTQDNTNITITDLSVIAK